MKSFQYAIFVGLIILAACSSKHKEDTDNDEWAAMDTFHMLMAEAYHPFKDSANLAPARAGAEELAQGAAVFASAELPEKVNNDDVRNQLDDLRNSARAFADEVKQNAPDSVISKDLTALHEKFHHITEAWHKEEEEHQR